jgi:hypothetical protein
MDKKNLARRYAVPIHVYPEASPRSLTMVGTAVETMVCSIAVRKIVVHNPRTIIARRFGDIPSRSGGSNEPTGAVTSLESLDGLNFPSARSEVSGDPTISGGNCNELRTSAETGSCSPPSTVMVYIDTMWGSKVE